MPVNPAITPILEAFADFAKADWSNMTVAMARDAMDNPMAMGSPPAVERIEDFTIALEGRDIAARLYIPHDAKAPLPLTLFYHGGGWVLGSLETHDVSCRELANASGSAILSVDYRRAPEARYPLPLDDCYDALVWAARNGETLGVDASRFAVAGDSAGGNLAAAVAIRARDEGGPKLVHQLLIYPVIDADFSRDSYKSVGSGGYFLSTNMMQWFWAHYLGDRAPGDAPFATLLQTADLSGLPAATVLTCEYDPLKDEGRAYAEALVAAKVPATHIEAEGMIHGFLGMTAMVPDALPYVDRLGAALRKSLA